MALLQPVGIGTIIFVSDVGKVSASDVAVVVGAKPRGCVPISGRAFQLVISGRSGSGAMTQSNGLSVFTSTSESRLSTPVRIGGNVRALELTVGGTVSVPRGSMSEGKFSKPRLDVDIGLSPPLTVDVSERLGPD